MKIDGTSPDDLQPLDPALGEEVYEWASELRLIWSTTGLSISRFARLNPVNKGTVSRWLAGERVPRDPWFLDRVLAIRAERGTPVTDEVREHLTELHLRALQAAHPHEYRVRLISDELMTARTRQQERERYARELEGQLLERNRRSKSCPKDNDGSEQQWQPRTKPGKSNLISSPARYDNLLHTCRRPATGLQKRNYAVGSLRNSSISSRHEK
jgi:hypothetical protein